MLGRGKAVRSMVMETNKREEKYLKTWDRPFETKKEIKVYAKNENKRKEWEKNSKENILKKVSNWNVDVWIMSV